MPEEIKKVKLVDTQGDQVYPYIDPNDVGTTVVANPTLAGTEAILTGVEIGSTKYKVPENVVANPVLVGSENSLTSLQVGSTKYKIPTVTANPVLVGTESYLTGLEVNGTKFSLLKDDYVIYDSKDHSGELTFFNLIDANDVMTWFVTKQSIAGEIDEYEGTYFEYAKVNLDTYNYINKLKAVVTITPVIDGVRDETKTFVRQFKFEDIAQPYLSSENTFDYAVTVKIPTLSGPLYYRRYMQLNGTIAIEPDLETGDIGIQVDSAWASCEEQPEGYEFVTDRIIWLHPNSVDGKLIANSVREARDYPADEGDYSISVDQSGNTSYKPIPSAGMSNPMTTEGDIIIGSSSGTPTRLAVGANGKVLKSNGTTVSWQDDETGSTVVANPTLAGTESDLTALEVDGTKYAIPSGGGGTTVIANPTLVGTEAALTGIQIGNVKYEIPTKAAKVDYLTTAPAADNYDGLIFVVLPNEPLQRYNGYIYIITGTQQQ